MTVDAVPVRACASGTDAGCATGDAPAPRLPYQEALGADAWPGFTPKAPKAAPEAGAYREPEAGSRV